MNKFNLLWLIFLIEGRWWWWWYTFDLTPHWVDRTEFHLALSALYNHQQRANFPNRSLFSLLSRVLFVWVVKIMNNRMIHPVCAERRALEEKSNKLPEVYFCPSRDWARRARRTFSPGMFYSQIFKPCPVPPPWCVMCMQKPSQELTGPALLQVSGLLSLWNLFRNSQDDTTHHTPLWLVTTLLLLLLDRCDFKIGSRFPQNPQEGKDWKLCGKVPMPLCDPSDCIGLTGSYSFHSDLMEQTDMLNTREDKT